MRREDEAVTRPTGYFPFEAPMTGERKWGVQGTTLL